MERETGIEPATSSLGSWRSTAELLPLIQTKHLNELTKCQLSCNLALMRCQRGWLTKESGSWLGHFNRRFTDPATGEIIRQQPSFVIGRVADLTKPQAMRALRDVLGFSKVGRESSQQRIARDVTPETMVSRQRTAQWASVSRIFFVLMGAVYIRETWSVRIAHSASFRGQ
jgi:hypothetical protein